MGALCVPGEEAAHSLVAHRTEAQDLAATVACPKPKRVLCASEYELHTARARCMDSGRILIHSMDPDILARLRDRRRNTPEFEPGEKVDVGAKPLLR